MREICNKNRDAVGLYVCAGGNDELNKLTSGQLTFIGSGYEETPAINKPVKDGDTFTIGDLTCQVMHAPCHTKGHILYFIENPRDEKENPLLFTGQFENN